MRDSLAMYFFLNPCVLCLSCVFCRITSAQQHGHDHWNRVRRPVSARHDRRGGLRRHEGDAQPSRLRRVSASQPHNSNLHICNQEIKAVRSELDAAEGADETCLFIFKIIEMIWFFFTP